MLSSIHPSEAAVSARLCAAFALRSQPCVADIIVLLFDREVVALEFKHTASVAAFTSLFVIPEGNLRLPLPLLLLLLLLLHLPLPFLLSFP